MLPCTGSCVMMVVCAGAAPARHEFSPINLKT